MQPVGCRNLWRPGPLPTAPELKMGRMMDRSAYASTIVHLRPRLTIAASNGLHRSPMLVAPIDAPELPMVVSFEGLSPVEQRSVLAAFPGGRRFVLQT